MIYRAKGNIVYGNINVEDYDAFSIYCNVFDRPNRDTTRISVPGRNGEVIFDNGRYQDIRIDYMIMVRGQENAKNLLAALLTKRSFERLEDSYDPEVYKIARLDAAPTIDRYDDEYCLMSLHLTRKPQRFLKAGEEPITVSSTGTIYNPTLYDSLPLIRAYGNGTLAIGSQSITVAGVTQSYIDIDSDIQNAFNGGTNLNDKLTLTTGNFLKLLPGVNNITVTSFSSVVITPRWWSI